MSPPFVCPSRPRRPSRAGRKRGRSTSVGRQTRRASSAGSRRGRGRDSQSSSCLCLCRSSRSHRLTDMPTRLPLQAIPGRLYRHQRRIQQAHGEHFASFLRIALGRLANLPSLWPPPLSDMTSLERRVRTRRAQSVDRLYDRTNRWLHSRQLRLQHRRRHARFVSLPPQYPPALTLHLACRYLAALGFAYCG